VRCGVALVERVWGLRRCACHRCGLLVWWAAAGLGLEASLRGVIAQTLARACVELMRDRGDVLGGVRGQVGALGEVLAG
jgi:hypothetical protein